VTPVSLLVNCSGFAALRRDQEHLLLAARTIGKEADPFASCDHSGEVLDFDAAVSAYVTRS